MDLLVTGIQLPFLAVSLFFAVYLLVVTTAAIVPQPATMTAAPVRRRFAIIVPAHNEEQCIEHTLQSVRSIWYPPELFTIIVVADNCTDNTAQTARAGGAIVYERFDTVRRGKGAALNWIIPQVLNRLPRFDACVFVDADIEVSPNFLEEMNLSLQRGFQVIQSSDLVLRNSTSWRVQLAAIALALQNYCRPLGRSRLGLSNALKGTGMCFASEALRGIQWDENSLVEDLDLTLDLIRRGIVVHFNPRAAVYAAMPTLPAGAATQRLRWEGGRFHTLRQKVPGLLKEAARRRNLQLFDAAIDAAFPPLVPFAAIVLCFLGFNVLCLLLGWPMILVVAWLWGLIVVILVVHCAVGVILAGLPLRDLRALMHLPRFFAWKLGIYGRMIKHRGEREWVRTAREDDQEKISS